MSQRSERSPPLRPAKPSRITVQNMNHQLRLTSDEREYVQPYVPRPPGLFVLWYARLSVRPLSKMRLRACGLPSAPAAPAPVSRRLSVPRDEAPCELRLTA